jgi:transcriptional regulator with XRE-family HTH domain
MTTIGSRVRHLRKLRGYNQEALAALVGISQGSLSLIEKDKTEMPSGATLAGLCKHLRTTPDYILSGVEDPSSINNSAAEHELLHLWRALPEDGRKLVIENALAVHRVFRPPPA